MNLRARAAKLFGRDGSENAVRVGRVDQAVFSDLRRRAPKIDDVVSTPPTLPSGERLDGRVWEKLAEDVFSAHYSDDEPSVRARDRIDPRFHVNREVDDKLIRSESFIERRSMTRNERGPAAMGLLGELESLAKSYAEELAEHGEKQNEVARAQDEIEHADDMLEHLRELRNDGDPGGLTTEQIDEMIRENAKRKRATVDQLKRCQAQQRAMGGRLVDAARKAAGKAAQQGAKYAEIASLMPGKGEGPGRQMAPELMLELFDRMKGNQALQRMLALVGQIEVSMSSKRAQLRKGGYEEIVDIEQGNDLRNVLPMERALLAHPIASLDFYRRYLDRSLTQYEMWSEEELKRGPGIIAADGSSSMNGAPNEFCRALTLATMTILNREHRNCAALEFGSKGQLREFWFPAGRALDPGTCLDFLTHFYAGGTDINQTLVRAKALIDDEEPFHSADLVIITDGGDIVTEQTIELRDALRAMGVKIHGLVVGARVTDYVLTVCDTVSTVFDYAGPNESSDRLAIDLS